MRSRIQYVILLSVFSALVAGFCVHVSADRFQGGSYIIDTSAVGDSIAGSQTGGSYELTDSGGASIIGSGSGGSHLISQGYSAQLQRSLQLTLYQGGFNAIYTFDEMTGTVVHDTTDTNLDAVFVGVPTWTAGQTGGGLTGFTASNYLTTNSTTQFDNANLTAVVCAWVKPTTTGTSQTIVARADSGMTQDGMWWLGLNSAGQPRAELRLGGTTYSKIYNASSITLGNWYNICMTYSGASIRIIVNGDVMSTAVNLPLVYPTQSVTIGARGDGTMPLTGVVDTVKFYPSNIPLSRIVADYNAVLAGYSGVVSLGEILPAEDSTSSIVAFVQTDAPGYTVYINQDGDMTTGSYTISPVNNGGTITSPAAWTSGSTKGLGFTFTNAPSGASRDPKWGNSPNYYYAAVPNSPTAMFTRSTYNAGAQDKLSLQFRLDTPSTQVGGSYTNVVTLTGTMAP